MSATPTFAERILLVHHEMAAAGVGHAFGGAVALAYYVEEPRATRDIDVNISVPTGQARSVLDCLPAGVDVPSDALEVIERDGQIRLWWGGRSGIPVDLFFPQHEFHQLVARDATEVPFLDTSIPIISATHLAVFKCLFNRPRDWPDISAMVRAGAVDIPEALGWLDRLLGPGSAVAARLADLATGEGGRLGGRLVPDDALPVVDWQSLGGGP